MILELVSYGVGALGILFGASAWVLARRWAQECQLTRIVIARKGRVALDAPLTEWIAWRKALPKRERSKGTVVFSANGVQVALARPTIGPAATTQKTRQHKDPAHRPAGQKENMARA